MSEKHDIIRVFVASPSGLDDERRAVWDVIGEINRRNASHWRLQFKAVGWEDTVGGNRRAQDIINRDLETCDYFFGILSDHWGSPPQSESNGDIRYKSGFHEEYDLAQKLFKTRKMKDILLFFKDIPDDRLRDIGPSLQKVLDFRKQVRMDRKPLYHEFDELELFKDKIGDALNKIGWDAATTPMTSSGIAAPSDQDTNEVVSRADKPRDKKEYLWSYETRGFLALISDKPGEQDALTNVEVARLRLISLGASRVGNDEVHLGVHDSNLLFLSRADLNLSNVEKRTLLKIGLRYMENQNVPFWYWTDGDLDGVEQFIQYQMIFGDEDVSSSALKIGEIFGYRLSKYSKLTDRKFWIKKWFEDERRSVSHNAAQAYLSRWAEESDMSALQEVRYSKSGRRAAELDSIIVAVRFRTSQSDGLAELKRRNPEHISEILQETIQDTIPGLSSPLLQELAKLKAEYLRLLSTKELSRRHALSRQLAEELSGDNSIDVRLEAIRALSDMAVPISENRAKEALTVVSATGRLAGLIGGVPFANDFSKFEEYQRYLLSKKTLEQLLEIERNDSPFSADALLTACYIFPRRTAVRLRSLLKDGFKDRFDSRLKEIERLSPLRAKELAKSARDLKGFSCRRQTQAAIDILAAQLKGKDLALIREIIDRREISASKEVLSYLFRFGAWEDVERILKLKENVTGQNGLLSDDRSQHDKLVGKTLFKVGRLRIVDLLEKIKSHRTKALVIFASTQRAILGLSDNTLLELMNEDDDNVRKITALKCLQSLPNARINGLLDAYTVRDEFRYYNVIHWLDLGVSMPKRFAKKIVRKELEAW